MTQRSLILSAFLAALVLVVVGGVVAHLTGPSSSPELAQTSSPEPPAPEVAPAEATADPGAADAREARYRELVAEANRRLTEQQRALDAARRRARLAEGRAAAAPPRRDRGWDDDRWEHEEDDEHDEHGSHHEREERWEDDD